MATLVDMTQKEIILSVLRYLMWPRQVRKASQYRWHIMLNFANERTAQAAARGVIYNHNTFIVLATVPIVINDFITQGTEWAPL